MFHAGLAPAVIGLYPRGTTADFGQKCNQGQVPDHSTSVARDLARGPDGIETSSEVVTCMAIVGGEMSLATVFRVRPITKGP